MRAGGPNVCTCVQSDYHNSHTSMLTPTGPKPSHCYALLTAYSNRPIVLTRSLRRTGCAVHMPWSMAKRTPTRTSRRNRGHLCVCVSMRVCVCMCLCWYMYSCGMLGVIYLDDKPFKCLQCAFFGDRMRSHPRVV